MRRVAALCGLLAVAVAGLGALACNESAQTAQTPGGSARRAGPSGGVAKAAREAAPGFTLNDLDGRPISLADLRGRLVVLDFWATWCAPCVHQIPVLNEFVAAHHAADRVRVLGVAVDAEGRDVVAPFARKLAIDYTVLIGDETLASRYRAIGYPSLYVIDARGRIASSHVGVITREELEQAVAEAADGDPPEAVSL